MAKKKHSQYMVYNNSNDFKQCTYQTEHTLITRV